MDTAGEPRSTGTTTHDRAFHPGQARQHGVRLMTPLTVLTLSGSLRKKSLNTAMLTMAASCAPPGLGVSRPRGLGDLPLFNPDLEVQEPPPVARLRRDPSDLLEPRRRVGGHANGDRRFGAELPRAVLVARAARRHGLRRGDRRRR